MGIFTAWWDYKWGSEGWEVFSSTECRRHELIFIFELGVPPLPELWYWELKVVGVKRHTET